ncbi:hypothetical protein SDC9_202289 [bioreactor metagenome]|uniref:Uncharacterized protein n=1 Tax=bioreactor metagenome TaxID=1076179 RepID=A0A645IT98_9ZZZZ
MRQPAERCRRRAVSAPPGRTARSCRRTVPGRSPTRSRTPGSPARSRSRSRPSCRRYCFRRGCRSTRIRTACRAASALPQLPPSSGERFQPSLPPKRLDISVANRNTSRQGFGANLRQNAYLRILRPGAAPTMDPPWSRSRGPQSSPASPSTPCAPGSGATASSGRREHRRATGSTPPTTCS